MGETQSALPGLRHRPMRSNNRLADDRVYRPRRARGAGGRHPRPRRPSLLRHPPRRDRALLRARLQALGGLRPYRRLSARPGLRPRRQRCSSCVGAMGLYSISPDGRGDASSRPRPTAPGPRSSTMRGCAIPTISTSRRTGAIYFTDSTTRYEPHDWALDSIESRPPGACSATIRSTGTTTHACSTSYRYANGVCMAHDGQSLFFAETWACRVTATGSTGRRPGTVECVITRHAGLSRQHQPRLRRHLLDGLARHAHAELRSGAAPSRHSASA